MGTRVAEPRVPLKLAAKVRVIYGDTDRMGIVYHGTYLRYLEHGRVEFMRDLGAIYAEMERQGMGLPVTELAIRYLAPARYDDLVSIYVGVSKLGFARLDFVYKLVVEPGDRFVGGDERPLEEPLVVGYAESRHGCVSLEEGRITRLPEALHGCISGYIESHEPAQAD
jgi:acyl-CoA thioester hydrolase